jgi:hypothetical protein
MKVSAEAKVTLELSIDLPDSWSGTTTAEQINKQARGAMDGALRSLVTRMNKPAKEDGDFSHIRVKCTVLDKKLSLDLTE